MENIDSLLQIIGENYGAMTYGVIFVFVGTAFLKKLFKSVDPRVWSISLSVVAGLGYAFIETFVPPEIMTQISAFALLAFGFATGVYKLQK